MGPSLYKFGEGNGSPLQSSRLENPMDGGAWWAAVHGVTQSGTRLSDFTFTFHFHALEKEMAPHSSVLAWRIPGTGEPGGLPSMGLHRVKHDWSDLAAAACNGIENNLPDRNILNYGSKFREFHWHFSDSLQITDKDGYQPTPLGRENQYWFCKKMAVSSRKSGIGTIKSQRKTNFSQTGKKEGRFHGGGGRCSSPNCRTSNSVHSYKLSQEHTSIYTLLHKYNTCQQADGISDFYRYKFRLNLSQLFPLPFHCNSLSLSNYDHSMQVWDVILP